MAQRYTAQLTRELMTCKKKLKFLAKNNITVESVAKEKEEKRKRIERHKRAILKMKATSQGATGADALLDDILAEERRKNLLQKEADDEVSISPSEFKETAAADKTRKQGGQRKTRRKRRRKKRKSRRKKKTRRRRKKRKTRKRRR